MVIVLAVVVTVEVCSSSNGVVDLHVGGRQLS